MRGRRYRGSALHRHTSTMHAEREERASSSDLTAAHVDLDIDQQNQQQPRALRLAGRHVKIKSAPPSASRVLEALDVGMQDRSRPRDTIETGVAPPGAAAPTPRGRQVGGA